MFIGHLSSSPTSTDKIYTIKLVLHQQICDDAFAKNELPHDLVVGYWKCMFVDHFTKYIGTPKCVHYILCSHFVLQHRFLKNIRKLLHTNIPLMHPTQEP